MSQYNENNPILGSDTLKFKFEDYMQESLYPVEGSTLYEQMFYKADIPAIDSKTGRRWVSTFKVSKPQGPGGFAEYTEDMFKGMATPGLMGIMIPNDQEYTLSTKFQFASIGRSFGDKINGGDFYEAVKDSQFGPHIREQQLDTIKKAIFQHGIKNYAGEAADEATLAAAGTKLTWDELSTLASSVETYEVQVIDNRNRVGENFVNAVKAVASTNTGAAALAEANVIDYKAFQTAQAAFEAAGLRTYRWNTPRFLVSMGSTSLDNYNSVDASVEQIKLSMPNFKELFSKQHTNQAGKLTAFVSKAGYDQLWSDPVFRELVQVSGYANETGLSGRYNKFGASQKAIIVQDLIIVDMEQDYIHGSLASEGIDYGKSEVDGTRLNAALIATPGYNFITSSSDFGIRVTTKGTDQTDSIDRLALQEWMYTMFTFDVQVLTKSSFNMLIHAE